MQDIHAVRVECMPNGQQDDVPQDLVGFATCLAEIHVQKKIQTQLASAARTGKAHAFPPNFAILSRSAELMKVCFLSAEIERAFAISNLPLDQ